MPTPKTSIGERVLLLLLGDRRRCTPRSSCSLPFIVRAASSGGALPAKGISAVYFAALGLGFMFFEITMIQRLMLFLGYPTYSLTVTLASLLVSTGLGALLSQRFVHRADRTDARPARGAGRAHGLLPVRARPAHRLAALDRASRSRVVVALVVLAPLGLCLGMFMPLGLGSCRERSPTTARSTSRGRGR